MLVSFILLKISVIAAFAGNCVYYMFANYQDNRLIHEKDGDYQVIYLVVSTKRDC